MEHHEAARRNVAGSGLRRQERVRTLRVAAVAVVGGLPFADRRRFAGVASVAAMAAGLEAGELVGPGKADGIVT